MLQYRKTVVDQSTADVDLSLVTVEIYDDVTEEVVLKGDTNLGTADEAAITEYVEKCYLPDMKAMYEKRLTDFVLPGALPFEPTEEGGGGV